MNFTISIENSILKWSWLAKRRIRINFNPITFFPRRTHFEHFKIVNKRLKHPQQSSVIFDNYICMTVSILTHWSDSIPIQIIISVPDPAKLLESGSGQIIGIRIRQNCWYPDPAKLLGSISGKMFGIWIRQNCWNPV